MYSVWLSQFFLFTIVLLLSPLIKATRFSKVINEFLDNVTVGTGDVIQCEITETDLEETKNDNPIFTQACDTSLQCYVYHGVSAKCFSFKVRTEKIACIVFGNTAFVSSGNVEIVLEWNKESIIRERGPNNSMHTLKTVPSNGEVTDREYHGFWVRWLEDDLLEIGRENEKVPFLYHRLPRKLQINYVGILSWTVPGAWIIDRDPKCPGIGSNGTEVQKNMRTESDCMILK